ncbi:hypothetical protein [Nocardia brasiliensis]|uniref:hypothetical protein n=1 Tax=Nocardia brasiliensis TaxID=37326 RepID=UPI00245588A4|nr:hypothetical protein [Nocardia brasiliensis]
MPDTSVLDPPRRARLRGDLVGAGSAAVLVTAAFVVPRIASESWRSKLYAGAAPLFGNWLPHAGWGTVPAIALAIAVVAQGPTLARRLSWRPLLAVSWAAALGWAFALAMVDGWQRGFAGRLTDPNEYLHEVGGVTDIGVMLRGFADRILDFEPDSWTTHVSGHPPGALLFFVLLDRIGLGGGAWAGAACLLIGTSAVLAVAVALRALGAEDRARAALPFLVLAPAALWIAVSADAMFAGVTAWAVALLAIAARPGGKTSAAIAAGVLFALGIYLSYGLVLMAFPAVAVLIAARTARPLLPALAGALLVVAAFTLAGFWWLDGYHLVVQRYYQGIASERSYAYWWWGNLAATVCAVGLATAAGLSRALSPRTLRALDPTALLVAAALCAILAADLSGLSKAETERIWLPFDIWLLAATAFLPRAAARPWLALQAAATLLLVHTILTNW